MAEGGFDKATIAFEVSLFERECLRERTTRRVHPNPDEKWHAFLHEIRETIDQLQRRANNMKAKAKTKKKEEKLGKIVDLAEELAASVSSKQRVLIDYRENFCLPLPTVHSVFVLKELLKKDERYSPKSRKLLTPVANKIYLEPKYRTDNIVLIDVEKLVEQNKGRDFSVFGQKIPAFTVNEETPGDLVSSSKFKLSDIVSHRVLVRDLKGRLRAAVKLACANFTHWLSVYKSLKMSKSKTAEERRLQQNLKRFCYNPLACKGVVYFYEVFCDSLPRGEKSQVYIGQTTTQSFGKRIKEHQNDKENPSLFELFLQRKEVWPEKSLKIAEQEGKILNYEPKVVVLPLDYGLNEVLALSGLEGFVSKGDTLDKLQRDYANYFGARSPIGLNSKLPVADD